VGVIQMHGKNLTSRRVLMVYAGSIAISLLAVGVTAKVFAVGTLQGRDEIAYLLKYSPFGRWPDFALGAFAGLITTAVGRIEPPAMCLRRSGYLIGAAIFALLIGMDALDMFAVLDRLVSLLYAALWAAMLFVLSHPAAQRTGVGRALAFKPLAQLAVISYPLYLIQLSEPVQWLFWVGLGGIESMVLRPFVVLVLLIPVCWLLEQLRRGIEHALSRALLKRWVERPLV
jgi:peptidoglycan/LPS O-acetylase OafA/YrhL